RPAAEGSRRWPKSAKKIALMSSDLPRENSATKATTSWSSCRRSSICWTFKSICALARSSCESHSWRPAMRADRRRRQSLYASNRAASSRECAMPRLWLRKTGNAAESTTSIAGMTGEKGRVRAFIRLALAFGAITGRPAAEPHGSNGGSAHPAGLAFAAVHEIFELEITGATVAVEVIAQGRATLRDRFGERSAHLVDESREARTREPARARGRADAGAKERLVRVDVAHA